MSDTTRSAMPRLQADLLLLHAPAFFDFRDRSDIYFPYLSTSGDVPITPLYEYFPLGFKTLQQFLTNRGHQVKIANVSTLLLKYPRLDLGALFRSAEVGIFGIDLHWMIHVQGSLAMADLLKRTHPEVPIVFGGISSTYFADQLIRYPAVDMVMKGYDTHEPMDALMTALKGDRNFASVPNLVWKTASGEAKDNGLTYAPKEMFAGGIDWSDIPQPTKGELMPICELLSAQTVGCAFNCGWCGGSSDAFRRVYGIQRTVASKAKSEIEREFKTFTRVPNIKNYHLYSLSSYNESPEQFRFFLEQVAKADVKSVAYEQFRLTPDDMLRDMVKAHPKTVLTLSPESHDLRVARLAGRGVYSPHEMEQWIERALDYGIQQIDVWYFIGMPEQDEASVLGTVDYCRKLLERFKGKRVVPLLCPMIPFLDPASTYFEEPERHGYRLFYRTVEEHRRGMERASLIHRINYETRWLSRADLVRVGYNAVRSLTEIKGEIGFMPRGIAESVVRKIDDALEFIGVVHEIDCIADERERARELNRIGDDIHRRNQDIFFSGVANQAVPIRRQIGGRWFDEIPWDRQALEAAVNAEFSPCV